MKQNNLFKLAGRQNKTSNTVIKVDQTLIGGKKITVIAGPCAVENEKQMDDIAQIVKRLGAQMLRGGAFKPRTSPYSFQGLGEEGLRLLAKASVTTGLPVVTEVMSAAQVSLISKYAHILQIGARNMQNFELLRCVGKQGKPVLLKRGMSATIEEWLSAAEYIMAQGNHKVILCERGIRTFVRETRNTLDLSSVPVIKRYSHLPVIVDPSHAVGHWEYVESMALAAIAAGADGLMLEVHQDPEEALSDGFQSLKPEKLAQLLHKVSMVAHAIGRE